ncbi:MAG: solute carrier family 12 sodium/potassium/chloride transporter 2 [Neolewinella sp.]
MTPDHHNQDLALLLAYKMKLNWKAKVRIVTVVDDFEDQAKARNYLQQVIALAGNDTSYYHDTAAKVGTTCLFVLDSGQENIFA